MNSVEQIFNALKNKEFDHFFILKDVSQKIEILMKELEIYKHLQPKKEFKLIDFRIKMFKKDLEKYVRIS